MGSYKWGYNSLIRVISLVTLLITPRITTHEPPSRVENMAFGTEQAHQHKLRKDTVLYVCGV